MGRNRTAHSQIRAKLHRFRANLDQFKDKRGRNWSSSAPNWPIRPKLNRVWAKLGEVGRVCPKLGHMWMKFHTGFGPTSAEIDLASACLSDYDNEGEIGLYTENVDNPRSGTQLEQRNIVRYNLPPLQLRCLLAQIKRIGHQQHGQGTPSTPPAASTTTTSSKSTSS